MTHFTATLAAQAFERRRAYLRGQVAAGRLAASEANQRALPWLAIAALAGADLPELYEYVEVLWPRPRDGAAPARSKVRLRADQICDKAEALRTLAAARDQANAAAAREPTLERLNEASALTHLANALGVPPSQADQPRKAA